MNCKTIVAASGIAIMVALSPVFAGSDPFILPIEPGDACAGGNTECQYIFTAKSGSTKQITMARRCPDCTDPSWYYYNMPIYTKSQVQAGYFYNTNNELVLMVVYSADKEGKSGAIVSRTSSNYGRKWHSSVNITDNQHRFGLSVAPDSRFVATRNSNKLSLHKYGPDTNGNISWTKYKGTAGIPNPFASDGFAVIHQPAADGDGIVSVSFVREYTVQVYNFDTSADSYLSWSGFSLRHRKRVNDMVNDTAWFYDSSSSTYYLAAKKAKVDGTGKKNGGKKLGVFTTPNVNVKSDYSNWDGWWKSGSAPISGLGQGDDGIIYILSTDNQQIIGTDSSGNRTVLYDSNQNSSMQRRVSSFVVPSIW